MIMMKNISGLLADRLPPRVLELLNEAGRAAQAMKVRVYLVGGIVRDLLLDVPNLDVDLVVEGDGLAYAEALRERLGGEVKRYPRFGTAVLTLPDGFKLDVETARVETYERPAALPKVRPGSIEEDLFRRDFTINALAVSLNLEDRGRLLDLYGGLKDLQGGIVRILHKGSFIDDPTRIFRAVRFEGRYGFRIDPETEALIRKAVQKGVIQRLSAKRRFTELQRLLQEERPYRRLRRLETLGVLTALSSKLRLTKESERLFRRIEEELRWAGSHALPGKLESVQLYLLALLAGLSPQALKPAGAGIGLPSRLLGKVLSDLSTCRALERKLVRLRAFTPSRVFRLLKGASVEALLLLRARSQRQEVRRAIADHLTVYARVKVHLTGDDLKGLGIPPGPLYRRILERLLDAKLDGHVRGHQEELRYVRECFARFIPS